MLEYEHRTSIQLDDMLWKRGIVALYDPRREREPFFDKELNERNAVC